MGGKDKRGDLVERTRQFVSENAKRRKERIDTIRSYSLESLAKLDDSDLDEYFLLNFSDYEFGEDIIEYRLLSVYKYYKAKSEHKNNDRFLEIIKSLNDTRNSFWMFDSHQNGPDVAYKFSDLLLDIMAQSSDTSQQQEAARIKHAKRNVLYDIAIETVKVFLSNNTSPEWTHADFKNYILSQDKFKSLSDEKLLKMLREFFKAHDPNRIGGRALHFPLPKK